MNHVVNHSKVTPFSSLIFIVQTLISFFFEYENKFIKDDYNINIKVLKSIETNVFITIH
jgi:hypothetical protein